MNKAAWKKKELIPVCIMVVVLIIAHCLISLNNRDDVQYAELNMTLSLIWANLVDRWFTWSARLIVEFFLMLIVNHPIAWKTVNILMYVLLAYSLDKLLPETENRMYRMIAISSVLLIFPLGQMDGAGWVATTTGYFWTIAVGAYAFTLLMPYFDKGMKWYMYIWCALCFIFAVNHEQMGVMIVGTMWALAIWGTVNHKHVIYQWIMTVILTVELVAMLFAPGELKRTEITILGTRPDYYNTSFVRKMYEAYAGTMNYILDDHIWLFWLLAIVVLFAVIFGTKYIFEEAAPKYELVYKLIACYPLALLLLYEIDSTDLGGITRRLSVLSIEEVITKRNYLPIVVATLMLTVIIASLYHVYGNTLDFYLLTLLLGLGILCRIGTGITGTAFGSGVRTIVFLEAACGYTVLHLMFRQEKMFNKKWIMALMILAALMVNVELCHNLIVHGGAYIQ